MHIANQQLDLVLLVGNNLFFGKNRNTPGNTKSYLLGLGAELPMQLSSNTRGHLRVSGAIYLGKPYERLAVYTRLQSRVVRHIKAKPHGFDPVQLHSKTNRLNWLQ